jgi:D-serine deaminase-like pyridoxal phosphate-dependent protein
MIKFSAATGVGRACVNHEVKGLRVESVRRSDGRASAAATGLTALRDADVGRRRADLTTPVLLLDLAAARRNITTMAAAAAALGSGVRPHVKAHKCAQLAQLQLEAGAVGLTCATVSELTTMAAAGATDVFLANEIVDAHALDLVAAAAREITVTVAVDDFEHVRLIAAAARRAGAAIGIVVEVDVGMGRAGVRSSPAAAQLAEAVVRRPELHLRGVHGYEGHCVSIDDPRVRAEAVRAANEQLADAAEAVRSAVGSCDVVTAGGTATFGITARHPAITDVQAGSYVLMDSFHERLLPTVFEPALSVAGTVISRHGTTAVLNVGRKTMSTDFASPTFVTRHDVRGASFHEEHCVVEFEGTPPALGEHLEITPSYAPTTVHLHDAFHVIEDDVVVDVWPIAPRR